MDQQQDTAQDTPTAAEKLFDGNAVTPRVDAPAPDKKDAVVASEAAPAKPDEKKADDKTTEAAVEKPAAPEKYDLKMPESSKLSQDQIDKIAAIAREQGLSNEAAQKLVNEQHEVVSGFEASLQSNFKETVEEWKAQAAKDTEYGGAEFTRNVELAKRVVSRYGSDEFVKALDESGFGNHPELLRVFVRIGNAMGEDRLVTSSASSASSGRSLEDVFYGNNKT
jgi:hypothetical protein